MLPIATLLKIRNLLGFLNLGCYFISSGDCLLSASSTELQGASNYSTFERLLSVNHRGS
jgi:hypothetical protein